MSAFMPVKRPTFDLNHVKTGKFECTLDKIKIEKMISAPISTTIFLEISVLLDVRHCTKLQSFAISRKYDVTLRKWQNS